MQAGTTAGETRAEVRLGPVLVASYIMLMPLLAGVPRGTGVPLLRPSETLQVAVTGIGVGLVAAAVMRGDRWRVHVGPTERWLVAVLVASSIVPLLWLAARGEVISGDEVITLFPLVKYVALYVLVRAVVRTDDDVDIVVRGVIVGAVAVSAVAFAQTLGIGSITDVLGQYFVSSSEDAVDAGRATTTIGSSIATGSYLAMSTGLSLSFALSTRRLVWLLITVVLGMATLATGQASAVLSVGIIVLALAIFHRRLVQVVGAALPLGGLAVVALWPVVAARLDDLEQGSGLPSSWIIRWTNVSELYLPSLVDGGWVLGVTPDAVAVPPDVWREVVYLESGYLWFLWVGGLPLLIAAIGFLIAAWRELGTTPAERGSSVDIVRLVSRAVVSMVAIMSLFDPHITLRASGDLFFVLLALGFTGRPFAVIEPARHHAWRRLLDPGRPLPAEARLQMAEAGDDDLARVDPMVAGAVESGIVLRAPADGYLGTAVLALVRRDTSLHGVVVPPTSTGQDPPSLVWRAVVLCADSLRLESLAAAPTVGATGVVVAAPPPLADRADIRAAAHLGRRLESRRTAAERSPANRYGGATQAPGLEPVGRDTATIPVRLVVDTRMPAWKRIADVTLALIGLVVSAPLWLFCAAWIRQSSPGPILFRQLRVGEGGLPFQMYKFRTMYVDNDDSAHREQNRKEILDGSEADKDSDDVRITPAGRWLRRLSLDELPQLLNVLRAEMSVVGPRPSLLWEVELFAPSKRRRLQVRPGVTGLWQATGRADVSMSEMLEIDLTYVDEMGPALDARCLVGTAISVVSGRGAK